MVKAETLIINVYKMNIISGNFWRTQEMEISGPALGSL